MCFIVSSLFHLCWSILSRFHGGNRGNHPPNGDGWDLHPMASVPKCTCTGATWIYWRDLAVTNSIVIARKQHCYGLESRFPKTHNVQGWTQLSRLATAIFLADFACAQPWNSDWSLQNSNSIPTKQGLLNTPNEMTTCTLSNGAFCRIQAECVGGFHWRKFCFATNAETWLRTVVSPCKFTCFLTSKTGRRSWNWHCGDGDRLIRNSYFGVKTRVPTCLTRSHILYRFLWNCYARRHGETQSTWTRTAMPSGVIW